MVQELVDGGAGNTFETIVIEHQYGSWFYDLAVSVPFTPYNGETLFVHPVVRNLSVPASWVGSKATALSAPAQTAQSVTIYKDNTTIGTITFPVGSKNGTFSGAATSIAAGMVLRVVGASNPDNLFRDVGLVCASWGPTHELPRQDASPDRSGRTARFTPKFWTPDMPLECSGTIRTVDPRQVFR